MEYYSLTKLILYCYKKKLLPFVLENVKIQPHFNTMKKNTIESIMILFKQNCDLSN